MSGTKSRGIADWLDSLGRWLRENYIRLVMGIGGVGTVVGLCVLWFLSLPLISELFETVGMLDDSAPPVSGEAAAEHAERLRNLALAIGGALAGVALLAAIPFQLIKAWVNERQTDAREQGLITDRLTRAIEQLGAEKTVKKREAPAAADGDAPQAPVTVERTEPNLEVRLGAIYALERIAQDSPRDHVTVMETLCAYIRHNAPASTAKGLNLADWESLADPMTEEERRTRLKEFWLCFPMMLNQFGPGLNDSSNILSWVRSLPRQRIDIQAALTVIGRRGTGRNGALRLEGERKQERRLFALDLRGTNLQAADLTHADLRHALLHGARMDGADLREARLESAQLPHASLQGADLGKARLQDAKLEQAKLTIADFLEAKMQNARLIGAKMDGANLGKAEMQKANLFLARLRFANLNGAQMQDVDLEDAEMKQAALRSTDLTNARIGDMVKISSAYGVRSGTGQTILPDGLEVEHRRIAHWFDPEDGKDTVADTEAEFQDKHERWLSAGSPVGVPMPEGGWDEYRNDDTG